MGSLSIPTTASGVGQYVGYAYDPQTHEILGSSSGQFNDKLGELKGKLQVDGYNLNLSKKKPDQIINNGGAPVHKFEKSVSNGKLNHAQITQTKNTGITGYVETDSGKKLGFTLAHKDKNASELLSALEETAITNVSTETHRPNSTMANEQQFTTESSNKYRPLLQISTTGNNDYDNGYEHVAYISADDTDDINDYDEIPAGGSNRFNLQQYFSDAPSWSGGGKGAEGLGSHFEVHVDYATNGENNNLAITKAEPTSGQENWGFSIGISVPLGPISVGHSISLNMDSTSYSNNPHNSSTWDSDSIYFPRDQEHTRGVYFDLEAGGNLRQEAVNSVANYEWRYKKMDSYGYYYTVYTTSVGTDLITYLDVINT